MSFGFGGLPSYAWLKVRNWFTTIFRICFNVLTLRICCNEPPADVEGYFDLDEVTCKTGSMDEEEEENMRHRSLLIPTSLWSVRVLLFQLCSAGSRKSFDRQLLVSLIKEAGANCMNELGETPLAVAVKRLPSGINHTVFKALLENGADAMMQLGTEGSIIANVILHFGDEKSIRTYLPYHKDLEAHMNNRCDTVLHIMASRKERALASYLLEHGADPDVTNCFGITPLHLAAKFGAHRIVRDLLCFGADINKKCTIYGFTALHYACLNLDTGVIDVLMRYKKLELNSLDVLGRTPLYHMITNPCNKPEILTKLLDAGAVFKAVNELFCPLHVLAYKDTNVNHALDYAKILIRRELTDVNGPNSWSYTPLQAAAYYGTVKFIKFLLQSGADCNTANDYGDTAMDIALQRQRTPQLLEIMKHIVLQSFKGQPISTIIQFKIDNDMYLKELETRLQAELRKLSTKKGSLNYSYLDILCANDRLLKQLTLDDEVIDYVKKFDLESHRHYGIDVKLRFGLALQRRQAVDAATKLMMDTFDGRLPYYCAIKIADYLTTDEILLWKHWLEGPIIDYM